MNVMKVVKLKYYQLRLSWVNLRIKRLRGALSYWANQVRLQTDTHAIELIRFHGRVLTIKLTILSLHSGRLQKSIAAMQEDLLAVRGVDETS